MHPNHETLNSWLMEIGNQFGVDLGLTEDGICSIEYDNGLECNVEIDEHGEDLFLHAPLTEKPQESLEKFYEALLKLNAYSDETDGCAIGFCETSGKILLSRRLKVDSLDLVSLDEAMSEFAVTTARIFEEVKRLAQGGGGVTQAISSESPIETREFAMRI